MPNEKDLDKAKAATKGQGDERDKAGEVKEEGEKRAEVAKAEEIVTEEDLLKAIDLLSEFTKAQEETEEEEDDEDKKDEDKEEEDEEKALEASEDSETLEKAIEVSPFLEALVNETSLALEAVGKEFDGLKKSQSVFDGKYIESLKALTEIVKGFHSEMKGFMEATNDRLGRIESQPISAKKSITKAIEIKKSFAGNESGGDPDFTQLSKRQIAEALTKGWQDGKVKDLTIMAFEAEHNYQLTPGEQEIVKSYIK